MKAIILAAGQGIRLRPLTNDRPKCMVEFNSKPIVDYIIETMHCVGIQNIHIVTGYKSEVLKKYLDKKKSITYHMNKKYNSTNMLYSLWCANGEFKGDVIISYSDIIYSSDILRKLVDCKAKVAITIDKNWKKLWEMRMNDPLFGAESLVLDKDENIIEIGKKTNSYERIQGQYMGLIKVAKSAWAKVTKLYQTITNPNNMYMTDFLQLMVNNGIVVKAIPIYGGWIEIDSLEDFNVYEKLNNK